MPDEKPVSGAACPIVGVGASAGGLEAFSRLLRALPVDTGMAFVLVQHLAPSHASALAEILGRATAMPVQEVQDRATVDPDHVYVIPPGQDLIVRSGTLQLSQRSTAGQQRPIDGFFRTLAEECGHCAIGVILSGTANDGTLGLEAIKAEGGITFAQDASAQHDGMPQNAVASGCVDFVLPPEEIAHEIARIARNPVAVADEGAPDSNVASKLRPIMQQLLKGTGVDFTHYKHSTLSRRISRRMALHKLSSLHDYARLLTDNPTEVEALYQDILINVTSFFRDPEAYDALKTKVFPRLVKGRSPDEPLRVWTLGCSTGEEAYSLAIAFAEYCGEAGVSVPLQLFGTDLNASAIEKARAGVFSADRLLEMSPVRVERFFTEANGVYRISKALRDSCVFSRHNALVDPPFSRVALISCRNLLIYLEPVLQERIVPTLHFALKANGCLWLGSSETLGSFENLFDTEDGKHKIYTKRSGTSFRYPLLAGTGSSLQFPPRTRAGDSVHDLQRESDRALLSKFAPPSVLVTADLEILQYRGDTSPYLTPAPGKASLNLSKMLREGLLVPTRAAVVRAGKGETPAREAGVRVESDGGGFREVAIEVLRVQAGDAAQAGFLVLFEETSRVLESRVASVPDAPLTADPDAVEQARARLAEQLAATHDYLQSVIEQQEAANEELQSANEEVQSANEELQSTNEELETSKEEIQSSNEELAVVNDELNGRNAELSRTNDDLVNLLGSVHMPIVMLGSDFSIRRFNAPAEALIKLRPSDVGRSIVGMNLGLTIADLEPSLEEVLRLGGTPDREVQDSRGCWHSLRLRPYKRLDGQVSGVILILVDIDLLKRAREDAENIISTGREPLLVLDGELRVRTANRAYCETFGVSSVQVEGALLGELGNRQWDVDELRQRLNEVRRLGTSFNDFELRGEFEGLGARTMRLHARVLDQELALDPLILLAIEDITAEQQRSSDLLLADERKNEFLAMLAHELRNPLAPIRNALHILEVSEDPLVLAESRAMMQRQVDQMVRLVDDLLDVSRITRGTIDLRKSRLDLASLVGRAAEVARHACDVTGLELTVALPREPVFVNGDLTRLSQVVENLLSNARKFTDRGGRISVTVERADDRALIRVRDTGIGIAPDQLERVFEMFAQVDASLERSRSGLGIGLTLVKILVELHDGTVEVRSDGLDQGSEFIVSLPVSRAQADEVVFAPPLVMPASVRARRILVVDDNRDSAESLAKLLRIRGHETQVALDGVAALETAAEFRPDVVVLDIGLPRLNGFDAARALRKETWGKNILLIALTGWGQDEDRKKTREAGFDAHLVKPVDHEQLTKLLAAP